MTNDQQFTALFITYYIVSSVIMHVYWNLCGYKVDFIGPDYFFACFVLNMLITPFLLIWCVGKLISFAIMSIMGIKYND